MEPFLTFDNVIENLDIVSTENISDNFIIQNISTDTRTIEPEDIFVALRGSKFDGHNFVEEAIRKGASLCVVEQDWLGIL
jgi:UDP-N-acetylmuramoyl-tripeptide--D-alanyl-D-alanine ligase (EC 6.3.2.10)